MAMYSGFWLKVLQSEILIFPHLISLVYGKHSKSESTKI